jgi:hypothetical protein
MQYISFLLRPPRRTSKLQEMLTTIENLLFIFIFCCMFVLLVPGYTDPTERSETSTRQAAQAKRANRKLTS